MKTISNISMTSSSVANRSVTAIECHCTYSGLGFVVPFGSACFFKFVFSMTCDILIIKFCENNSHSNWLLECICLEIVCVDGSKCLVCFGWSTQMGFYSRINCKTYHMHRMFVTSRKTGNYSILVASHSFFFVWLCSVCWCLLFGKSDLLLIV